MRKYLTQEQLERRKREVSVYLLANAALFGMVLRMLVGRHRHIPHVPLLCVFELTAFSFLSLMYRAYGRELPRGTQ